MDNQLERLIDDLEQLVADRTFISLKPSTAARQSRANALAADARTALVAHMAEDTQRLERLGQLPGAQLCRTYDGGGSVLWWNAPAAFASENWKFPSLREAIDIATGFNRRRASMKEPE